MSAHSSMSAHSRPEHDRILHSVTKSDNFQLLRGDYLQLSIVVADGGSGLLKS